MQKFQDIYQNTTFEGAELAIKRNNVPINLTGCEIVMVFNTVNNNSPTFDFKTSDNTITVTDAVLGKFKLQPRILTAGKNQYFAYLIITDQYGSIDKFEIASLKII